MLALDLLDADLYAVLVLAGFAFAILALVNVLRPAVAVLAAACVLVFFALAWNGIAVAGW